MASPIPKDVLKTLKADPFMSSCCICGRPPQYHHNFEYGRKAVNEAWAILPLCVAHHKDVREINYRRLLDWAMYNRATDEDLIRYSRVMNYLAKRKWLNALFGQFSPRKLQEYYANDYHKNQTNLH